MKPSKYSLSIILICKWYFLKIFLKLNFWNRVADMQERKTFPSFILQNIFGLVTESAKDRLEIKTFMIIGHDLFES